MSELELLRSPEGLFQCWQQEMQNAVASYQEAIPHSTVTAGVTLSRDGEVIAQQSISGFDQPHILFSIGKLSWGAYSAMQISRDPQLQFTKVTKDLYKTQEPLSPDTRLSLANSLLNHAGRVIRNFRQPNVIGAMQTMLHGEGEQSNIATGQIKNGLSHHLQRSDIADVVQTWLGEGGFEVMVQGSSSVQEGRRGNIATPATMINLFNTMLLRPQSLGINEEGHNLITHPLSSRTSFTNGLDIVTSRFRNNSWGKSGWDPEFDPRKLPDSVQQFLAEATELSLDQIPQLDCNHRLEAIVLEDGAVATLALFTQTPIFADQGQNTIEAINRLLHQPFHNLLK